MFLKNTLYYKRYILYNCNLFSVYVFLGTRMSLVELMNIMQSARMFENGEYMVIFVDMNAYSEQDVHRYLWSKYNSLTFFILSVSFPAVYHIIAFAIVFSCVAPSYKGSYSRTRSYKSVQKV